MLNQLQALRTKGSEEGFTLIELMIVVVIIGILAAIAIPIFLNQQKSAIAASLKSDVKNGATKATTFLVKNPTATAEQMEAGVVLQTSPGNQVTINGAWDGYYIRAVNPDGDPNCYEYDSTVGKIRECNANPGEIGDPDAIGGGNDTPVLRTVASPEGGWIVGNRQYNLPGLGYQIHEDGGVTVSSNNTPITYNLQGGAAVPFTGTMEVPIHRAGPGISGSDTVTVTVVNGLVTGTSGNVGADARGIAGGNPGNIYIQGTDIAYTDR